MYSVAVSVFMTLNFNNFLKLVDKDIIPFSST